MHVVTQYLISFLKYQKLISEFPHNYELSCKAARQGWW